MAEMTNKTRLEECCPRMMHLTSPKRMPISINPHLIKVIEKTPDGTLLLTEHAETSVTESYEDVLTEYSRAVIWG